MAKFLLKIKARKLRRNGFSEKEIANKLRVSKGSVSIWCRDIRLSRRALSRLIKRMERGGYLGRLRGAQILKNRRLRRIEILESKGKERIGKLNLRDFLISGAVFYWAEGNKKTRALKFTNSDPEAIKLMMDWFRTIWNIETKRFRPWVGINQIHKKRIKKVEKYWSKLANLPLKQFALPVFYKAKNKKIYENFQQHYGTFNIEIKRPSEIKHQIQGLIQGIINGRSGLVSEIAS